MPIVEYTPEYFDALQGLVQQVPRRMNLSHRPFVDYYYASRNSCKLYLFLSDSGQVLGTIGSELLRFEYKSSEITIRIGSNWFSLSPGIGGRLSTHSAMRTPGVYGMVFMASPSARRVLKHLAWVPMQGVGGYFLNACSLKPWNSWWKTCANLIVRGISGKRIPALAGRIPEDLASTIQVREEFAYSPDILPGTSPFALRFAPTAEYLGWRYNLSLSFVRYRLFRIFSARSIGYVILNDSPEQIIVAQCDGNDATALSYGVLLAILRAGEKDAVRRSVFLACCHSQMAEAFERFGFKKWFRGDLPFGFRNVPPMLNVAEGTSNWLINYDWSDNGLQAPFADQSET